MPFRVSDFPEPVEPMISQCFRRSESFSQHCLNFSYVPTTLHPRIQPQARHGHVRLQDLAAFGLGDV